MHTNRQVLDDLGIFALMAKALSLRPLGHDRFESSATAGEAATTDASAPRRSLIDRIDHWLWERAQRDVEAYLGQAKDVYDLEARIRNLERGFPTRYY